MIWVPGAHLSAWARTNIIRKKHRRIASPQIGFWMDRHPVTNQLFREFVSATGHVTLRKLRRILRIIRTPFLSLFSPVH